LIVVLTEKHDRRYRGTRIVVRKVSIGFGAAIAFLIVIAGFAYRNSYSYVAASGLVAHTYQVLGALSDVVSHLNEAESQQRAYLITDNVRYLQWRDRLFSEIQRNVATLAELTADDPVQQPRVRDLEQKIAMRFDAMEEMRRLRDTQGLEAVQRRILSGVGPTAMDGIRAVMNTMETEERRLLQLRNAEVRQNADVLLGTSAAVVLVISLFLAWLLMVIRKQMVHGRHAAQAIQNLNIDLQNRPSSWALPTESWRALAIPSRTICARHYEP
jgi:CHASE3 domain sensor protein